jgi:hypothetical protein
MNQTWFLNTNHFNHIEESFINTEFTFKDNNKENDNLDSIIYKKKISDLLEKICDESTTVCLLGNGDVSIVKTKNIIHSFIYDPIRKKFFLNKSGNNSCYYIQSNNITSSKADVNYNNPDVCPIYNRHLQELIEELMKESSAISVLENRVVLCVKISEFIIHYKWDNNLNDFIMQKQKRSNFNKELYNDYSF